MTTRITALLAVALLLAACERPAETQVYRTGEVLRKDIVVTVEAAGVIEPFLSQHRIISRGRYGGWNYSAMADAIRFGRDAADEAGQMLASEPPRGSP